MPPRACAGCNAVVWLHKARVGKAGGGGCWHLVSSAPLHASVNHVDAVLHRYCSSQKCAEGALNQSTCRPITRRNDGERKRCFPRGNAHHIVPHSLHLRLRENHSQSAASTATYNSNSSKNTQRQTTRWMALAD